MSFINSLFESLFHFRKNHPLFNFIIFRFASMLVILFILGLAVFGLMSLAPGDIVEKHVQAQLMSESGAGAGAASSSGSNRDIAYSEEKMAAMRAELGLDKPFYIQYIHWLKQIFIDHDLGRSLISRAPILYLIKTRLFNSILLNLISLLLLTVISFALGIYFSSKAGTRTDLAATFTALFLHSFPGLLLLILLQLFAAVTGLFPVTAYPGFPFSENPGGFVFSYMHHITLPLIGAFLGGIGGTMRMIRATMLDQLGQPYITALRARGIREGRVYFAHAFRNTLNPYITSSANLLASLFSGSLILEIIFSYPGIGRLMYEAVLQEDIYLVLTNLMFTSFLVLFGMVMADILLAVVDPRIRYSNK